MKEGKEKTNKLERNCSECTMSGRQNMGQTRREFEKSSDKKCSECTRLSTIQGNGPDKERILGNELKMLGGVKLVVPFCLGT